MVTVQEATDLISQFLFDTAIVEVDFEKSVGYMLAEDICADRDFPPFNRVMMDGIAINFDSWKSGIKSF
ncbi:MAG: molybdopterin molybdenumtransferase MoeA, partial [Cyclobacteriaceae bacterium]|nr:molybdopterin molybdenumtransferase MoeA [Cyclobacteriaceae bacterium]